ncbi:NAD(P)-binding protein [Hypoxylon trugodes]|uniref:NAD(P)-binding protein n=1 Tax=Hypoxylon trugodes TaxID=326681 RepID=UPI00219EB443|nr:NAD(P)-binding protein [Hypoxylon trugodes]KAI1385672.1 NAD(P)-binding protein [Hypoxylon trugodes]
MTSPHPLSAASLFSLKDYVAVVTGGGTGLGLMIAQTLAANGAKVYITGRRADVLETSARVHGSKERLGPDGGSMVPLVMDVTSKDSIRKAVAEISDKENYVNVLVNNAGIWAGRPEKKPQDGPEAFSEAILQDEKVENWHRAFDVNCLAAYFVTAAFLPLLAKAVSGPTGKIGNVVNNSSMAGFMRMSQGCQFSYNVTKAAVSHLTRQMAYEFSHKEINVRVNGLALGYFATEMTTGESNTENESTPDDEKFAGFLANMGCTKVNRFGTPQEAASILLTVVTNEFMWGTISIVDGGFVLTLPGNM